MSSFLTGLAGAGGIPDIASTVKAALATNPTIAQLAKTASSVKSLSTMLPTIKDDIIKQVRVEVDNQVKESLAAGVKSEGPPSVATGDPGIALPDTKDPGLLVTEGESTNPVPQEGGGNKYEMVELTTPVDDPLYVIYEDGRATYFTYNGKDVVILPFYSEIESTPQMGHKLSKKKKVQKKAPKKAPKKVPTKKSHYSTTRKQKGNK